MSGQLSGGFLQRWRSRLAVRTRLRRWQRRRDPKRRKLARVLVNGFPKSGTHLLRRTIDLFPGMASESLWMPAGPSHHEAEKAKALVDTERLLASVAAGEYIMGHVRYSPEIESLLAAHGFWSALILRDPRDVAVSLAAHITMRTEHSMHKYFNEALSSDRERLQAAIVGVERREGKSLASLGQRLDRYLPWLRVSLNYTVRFERLVGAGGGGDAETQKEEILNLARHLGVTLDPESVERIAAQVFGRGSLTFRQGRIGSWRESFTEEHKEAFKQVAGRQLIELGYERDLNW